MKHILLTGGFTAGHVTPNLALWPKLQALGYQVSYMGGKSGIEKTLVSQTSMPFYGISSGKLRRYLDLENLLDLGRIVWGTAEAFFLIRKLKPDLIFSKGGFVACPPVWAGWLNRVPIIIHESDISPGLANRLSTPFANHICYSFPETNRYVPREKSIQTGIPIRDALLTGQAEVGRDICGFMDDKPIILVMGGSQGSARINEATRAALNDLLGRFNICHLCGPGHLDSQLTNQAGYQQFEFVDQELAHLYAMADLVISRAGATTLFELLALKKPHLLIPLPLSASRGDQILNANSFVEQGFSLALPEELLTPEHLIGQLRLLYKQRRQFQQAMETSEMANGLSQIINLITQQLTDKT